jgi:hypothetical protein
MHSVVLLALGFLGVMVAQVGSPGPGGAGAPSVAASASAAALPVHVAIGAATFREFARQTVMATDEHGITASYGGVALRDVLTKAGVPAGQAIRGPVMLDVVVVGASDGYRVVFALPELDPAFTDRVVIIADTRDGAPLPAREGPYQLIVPGDKRPARWVRQVTGLDVERIP